MGGRPAELLQPDLPAGELGHHLWTRDERHRIGAHHDEIGQTEQERRPRDDRAGGDGDDGNLPAAFRDGSRRLSPTVQGRDAVEHVRSARCDEEDEREPQLPRLVRRLGQPHTVGVGDGATAHRSEGADDDHVATADAADDRGDRTDDALADIPWRGLLQLDAHRAEFRRVAEGAPRVIAPLPV